MTEDYDLDLSDLKELPDDAWRRRDDPEIKDLIVLTYWPLLTRVVGSIRHRLPPHIRVDESDLRSYALLGLYRAIDAYDPIKGEFSKFASIPIYGATMDALRKLDWAPRGLRTRQKAMEKAATALRAELRRNPTEEELAEALRWTVSDVSVTKHQVDISYPRSLDELRGEAERDLYSVVASPNGDPEQHVLGKHDSHENDRSTHLADKMSSFISEMPVKKKVVAIFCYYLEMKQTDVASVLGIPESRVSSLHLSVMEDIHSQLEKLLLEKS